MKASRLLFTALATVTLASFTSCSDDDNNSNSLTDVTPGVVKPSQVFTAGMPTQAGDLTFTTNAQGQVTQIEQNDGPSKTYYTFIYNNPVTDNSTPGRADSQSPTTTADVVMTVTEGTTVTDQFYIKLNEKGFARYAYQTKENDSSEEWWFEYDPADRLRYMKRSEGGNEVTRIDYDVIGDITKVSMRGEESSDDYSISYTNEDITAPIANKGAIMYFDDCFGIDMDEFEPAYFAGLLGKATAHLPLSNTSGEETDTFTWSINENGFPVTLIIRENGSVSPSSPIFFNWL